MYLCEECLGVYKEYDISFTGTEEYDNVNELWEKYGSLKKRYEVSICPNPDCTGMIVEVDELILPTIIELNKKGWKTDYCCSGHLYEDDDLAHTYIKFSEIPPNIPSGFSMKDSNVMQYENIFNKYEGIVGFKELMNVNLELYEWAIGLPENE